MHLAVASTLGAREEHEHEHQPDLDEDGNPIDYDKHQNPKAIKLTNVALRKQADRIRAQKREEMQKAAIEAAADALLASQGYFHSSSNAAGDGQRGNGMAGSEETQRSDAAGGEAVIEITQNSKPPPLVQQQQQRDMEVYHSAMKNPKIQLQNGMAMAMFRNTRRKHTKNSKRKEFKKIVRSASTDPALSPTTAKGSTKSARGHIDAYEESKRLKAERKLAGERPAQHGDTLALPPRVDSLAKVHPEVQQLRSRSPRSRMLKNRNTLGEDTTEHDLSPELLRVAEENRQMAARKLCWAKMKQAGFVPMISVLTWIVLGTCVYHFGTGFYWSQAFFYAVDSGFSIGFGAFIEGAWNDSIVHISWDECGLEVCANQTDYRGSLRSACVMSSYEPDLWSMAYTIFHILFGASMVATALTLLLLHTLERNEFSPEDLKKKEIEVEKERRERQQLHNQGIPTRRASTLMKTLGGFAARRRKREAARRAKCLAILKAVRDYWREAVKSTLFKATSFLLLWMACAITYGMLYEQWTFIEGLYFAVSAASTAGLLAPTHHFQGNELNCTNDPNRECQTFPMVFVGIYCFVAVPVFAMVLGGIAGFQVDRLMELNVKRKLEKSIAVNEFEYANKLKGGHSAGDCIDFCEYLQLALLRSGLVDQGRLDDIHMQFQILDINNDGGVTRTEVAAMSIFSKFDVDGSGTIDFLEYLLCVDSLNEFFPELEDTHDEDHLEDMFIKVSLIHIDESGRVSVPDDLQAQLESYTDEDLETRRITRVQFMVWCKDNISAMASKLKIDAATADADGDGRDDEVLFNLTDFNLGSDDDDDEETLRERADEVVQHRLNVATDLRTKAEKAIAAAREAAKMAEEAKARAREAELRLDAVAKVTRGITSAALADQIQQRQNFSTLASDGVSDASEMHSKTPKAKLVNGPHSFAGNRKTSSSSLHGQDAVGKSTKAGV